MDARSVVAGLKAGGDMPSSESDADISVIKMLRRRQPRYFGESTIIRGAWGYFYLSRDRESGEEFMSSRCIDGGSEWERTLCCCLAAAQLQLGSCV